MSILKKPIYRPFVLVMLIGLSLLFIAQTPSTREYQIKAVFLFNFTQFVEWPSQSFSNDQAPLVIGILGRDPFGTFLEEALANEKVNGHPLVIQRFKTEEDIIPCHVLFIHSSEHAKTTKVLAKLKGRHILSVSDDSDFLKQGGMIRFFTKDNKIQLQINPEAAKSENLTISSKLLRLAEIVTTKTTNK